MANISLQRLAEDANRTRIQLDLDENPNAARLWALTLQMRIGSSVIKMGGIAGVGTDEEFRGRGLASRVMHESTRYFEDTGHNIAVLFGIPDFYHRFGYVAFLPTTEVSVRCADVHASGRLHGVEPVTDRAFEESDLPAILEMYNAGTLGRSGSLVRPAQGWHGFRRGSDWRFKADSHVIGAGEPLGYIVYDAVDDACRVAELGYRDASLFPALLQNAVTRAATGGVDEVQFFLPPDHPFVAYCKTAGTRVTTTYPCNRDGMARIINVAGILNDMSETLSQRYNALNFQGESVVLRIETEIGGATIVAGDGEIRVEENGPAGEIVRMPQATLAQMLLGYRSAGEIQIDEEVDVPAAARPWMKALFPGGHPWMSPCDAF